MKTKLRVAVLFGGPSAEHEVSLKSGAAILANLNKEYDLLPVRISKDNSWVFESLHKTLSLEEAILVLVEECDIAILGVHGTFGEDGVLQALLESNGIAHTGSSAAASLLAFDKSVTASVYSLANLPQPKTILVGNDSNVNDLGLPVVIKPARQGSSVGVSIVSKQENIEAAIKEAITYDTKVVAQQFIQGHEVSCGVLEIDGKPTPLPPTELIPLKSDFFDYESKYTDGGADEITPPKNVSSENIALIQDFALRAHTALGCSGYSRTDMIVADDGVYLIETNTLPGLTDASILPKQVVAANLSFSSMLDYIIQAALPTRAV